MLVSTNRKNVVIIAILVAVAVSVSLAWRRHDSQINSVNTPESSFNKHQFSVDDPKSIWVVVNKKRPLPPGYAPSDLVVPDVTLRLDKINEEMELRQSAAEALKSLFSAAKAKAGYNLLLASGYRSEGAQKQLYNFYVQAKGAAAADSDSARPSYSEHQTGLAVDVGRSDHQCEVQACFAATPEARWLAENAYKYGFIVRYQPGKQAITGYVEEPWHLRYVGNALASQIQRSGKSLEEFFGLPPAASYN